MIINGREIGPKQPPYIIAEIGANHAGSLKRVFELIDAAKFVGADAVKFQAYTADTITLDSKRPEFMIKDGPWKGRRLYDLYCETETPPEWFHQIKDKARRAGITWFASVFDKSSVDQMVLLDAAAIKIASFEIVDLPLIKYAAATGKPLIISTGMASLREVEAAYDAGWPNPALPDPMMLHCVSGYPTDPKEANLQRLRHTIISGISDHTIGVEIPIAATALGATIIEKHFRLSWHPDTEDSPFSLDEVDFARMIARVRNTWEAMQPSKAVSEDAQRPLRRSLFAVADIKRGEAFTEANVRSIRPGDGMPPADLPAVLGRKAVTDIARGEPLKPWLVFEEMSNGVVDEDKADVLLHEDTVGVRRPGLEPDQAVRP